MLENPSIFAVLSQVDSLKPSTIAKCTLQNVSCKLHLAVWILSWSCSLLLSLVCSSIRILYPCNFILATLSLQLYPCNFILATLATFALQLILQLYPCNFTLATLPLQLCPCNFILATNLATLPLQLYHCNFVLATLSLHLYPCFLEVVA